MKQNPPVYPPIPQNKSIYTPENTCSTQKDAILAMNKREATQQGVKKGLGFEKFTIGTEAIGLTVPEGSISALIVIEGNISSMNPLLVVRLRIDDEPTANTGIPIGNFGYFEVNTPENLNLVKLISADGLEHIAQVQYFN